MMKPLKLFLLACGLSIVISGCGIDELKKEVENKLEELYQKLDIWVAVLIARETAWKNLNKKYWRDTPCLCIHPDVPMNHPVNWPWKT